MKKKNLSVTLKRMKHSFNKSFAFRLFWVSFLILYFELVAIRFIPSQIRYVAYFSNLVLLASFVGIGLGTLFWKRIKIPLFFLPFQFFLFQLVMSLLKYDLIVSSDQVIYFGQTVGKSASEPTFLLPLIFFLVVLLFLLPAKILGKYLEKFPPSRAYTINTLIKKTRNF